MSRVVVMPKAPTGDKRWRIVETAMRRQGFEPHALIEALHSVQQAFGFVDELSMRYVAACLGVPLSKVYGVVTFYHHFTLKPQGKHACVVCLGTACYIKGNGQAVKELSERYQVKEGQTTADGELSLLTARCIGACGLAPVSVIDGEVLGKSTGEQLIRQIESKLETRVQS